MLFRFMNNVYPIFEEILEKQANRDDGTGKQLNSKGKQIDLN